MTTPENFVSRWARLKRTSEAKRGTEAAEDAPRRLAVDASAGSAEVSVAKPATDAAPDERFDPSALPSIEAITANTDVRGFLQSRVPAELTRAALRRAWASDPAIRDFIGIAENQWDFNDPNAIPGFGSLRGTDNVPALLARALSGTGKLAGMAVEVPLPVDQSQSAVPDHEPSGLDQNVQQSVDASPSNNKGIRSLPDGGSAEGAATRSSPVAEDGNSLRNRRRHGSAVPR